MSSFRYIGKKRRTKEDPRFVSGRGRYVADIALPGMKHVALVASPHAAARIASIRTDAAQAAPGVLCVLTGDEFCANTDSLAIGVDAPKVTRWALARGVVRYAGEWVAAVVADSRALAEDAAELVEVEYEPLPHVIDPEKALGEDAPLVHPAHGSNVLYRRKFVWGPVDEAFAKAADKIAFRAVWGRSSTVPIETTGLEGANSTASAVPSASTTPGAGRASSTPTWTKLLAANPARCRTHHSWKWIARGRSVSGSVTTTWVSTRWSLIGRSRTPGCHRWARAAVTSESAYPASSIRVRTRWVARSRSPSPNQVGSAP